MDTPKMFANICKYDSYQIESHLSIKDFYSMSNTKHTYFLKPNGFFLKKIASNVPIIMVKF